MATMSTDSASHVISLTWRARHRTRVYVSRQPFLYLPYARRRHPGPCPEVIGPETEVVIDGYTRSATTYAVYAFQLAQSRPVRVAHHLHAAAHLVVAAKRGIATIVPVREPTGAVLSQLLREPHLTLPDALIAYASFYRALVPYRRHFVVAGFDEVTADFGAVVRRLNERFGTAYAEFETDFQHVQDCLNLMTYRLALCDALLRFESGRATADEARVAVGQLGPAADGRGDCWVPSEERDARKAALRDAWGAPRVRPLVARAESAYVELIGSG